MSFTTTLNSKCQEYTNYGDWRDQDSATVSLGEKASICN